MPSCRTQIMLALMFVAIIDVAYAAGMATHTMVGERVMKYFGGVRRSPNAARYNAAIAANPEAVIAGSDFPDFLYVFNDARHDGAEEAHWPPWQAAATRYIRNLPDFNGTTWSDDTSKLVAFLFGVSIHFVADELWESLTPQLSRGQGMTGTVSHFNLGGNGLGNQNEGASNTASDFWVAYLLGTTEVRPWQRYYPLKHITSIYASYGRNVSFNDLETAHVLFNLGLWAENTFGPLLAHVYTEAYEHVPVIAEEVLDFPVGGIDDMAAWSALVWERVAHWLDEGPPITPPPRRRRLGASDNGGDDHSADMWIHDFVQSLRPFVAHADALLALDEPSNLLRFADPNTPAKGVAFSAKAALLGFELKAAFLGVFAKLVVAAIGDGFSALSELATSAEERFTVPRSESGKLIESMESMPLLDEGPTPLTYLGRSVVVGDFDGDGTQDVATGGHGSGEAGRPQVGMVSVRYNVSVGGSSTRSQLLHGMTAHGRFGWAVAALDINLDGICDLVVAAPFASWEDDENPVPNDDTIHFRYWGRVYVYLGSPSGLISTPSIELRTSDDLTYLGLFLGVGDYDGDGNNDLLVGAPLSSFKFDKTISDVDSIHRGALFALRSSAARVPNPHLNATAVLNARMDADLVIESPKGFAWFGSSIQVSVTNHTRVLLVGAPGYRVTDPDSTNPTTGAVYGFDPTHPEVPLFIIEGEENIAEFGAQVAASRNGLVAISSPAAGSKFIDAHLRGGEVVIMEIEAILDAAASKIGNETAVLRRGDVDAMAVLYGGKDGLRLGRFGTKVRFLETGNGDALMVGAHMASGMASSTGIHEEGAVYFWDPNALPKGSVSDMTASAQISAKGHSNHAHLGTDFALLKEDVLVVTAAMADGSNGASLAGKVFLLPITG